MSSIAMPPEGMEQAREGLIAIGVDPDDRWGSEWHYLGFRNALHGGRATSSSDYVARPAAQIPLIGLSRSPLNEFPAPKKGAPNVVLDALIKLSPELASMPFDDPSKNISESFLEDRLLKLGGPLTQDLQPYAIEGTCAPSRGVTRSQIELAVRAGFTGHLDPTTLLPRVDDSLRKYGHLVSQEANHHLAAIPRHSVTRLPAAARESATLGRLLALSVLG